MNFVLIALSDAADSVLGYRGSRWWNGPPFPSGMLAANTFGSFFLGPPWTLLRKKTNVQKPLLLLTGFWGRGFATFSAFRPEDRQLLAQFKPAVFFLYTFATIVLGLTASFLGFKLFTS